MATPILISLTASATNFNDIKSSNLAIGSSRPTNQIVDLAYRIDITQQGVLGVISGLILTDNIDVIPSEGGSIRNPQYLDSTAYGINYKLYKDSNLNLQLDSLDRLIDSKNITSNVSGYVVFQKSLSPGTYFLTLSDSNGALSSRSSSGILFDPGLLYGESIDNPNSPNTVTDFNKDGNSDILMSNASQGWSGLYTMKGTAVSSWVGLPYSSGAVATGAGDLDKDGNTDVLMSNASQGWSGFYTMKGTSVSGWVSLPYSSGAVATGAGDFNKDGNTDILMSNASQGWSGFYTMKGTSVSGWVSLPYSAGAVATGTGDFNKDGNTDILMSNASQGWSGFYTMNGTAVSSWVSLPYSSGAVATGAGDFNKDGNTDILMSNASQGWSGFYTMNGTSVSGWVGLPYASGAVAV